MDYCIRKLLGLTEENFITDENWLEIVTENHETVHKINGTWTSTCTSCLYCSSENVIKHSPMEHKIRIPHLYGNKTILDLKVQRFICKDCRKTWVADCPLVPKNSNISYDLECQIMLYLKENFSRKTIAKLLSISDKTVERVMKKFKIKTMQRYNYLPKVLCLDGENHQLIDILPGRTLHELISFFMKFSRKQRLKVKYLVMDMNASYQNLIKVVFPNAVIVVDRFHIVQHMNRNFNQLRVVIMKQFSAKSTQQKTLKRYWKLLLKPSDELDEEKLKYNYHFKTYLTQAQLVDKLLSFDEVLSDAYDFIQELRKAYKKKDYEAFMACIKEIPRQLPYEFKKKFEVFKRFKNGIYQAFTTGYSNGSIEGTNNLIKVIKRVAYGYRNFENMKLRIKIIKGCFFTQVNRKSL